MNEMRMIQRAYKTELDPNRVQIQAFLRHAGCARFIYNWGLTKKIEAYRDTGKSPSAMALNLELTALKRGECPWLYEVNTSCLQNTLRNLDAAYAGFFRRLKQGRRPGFPRYKSKKRGIGSFKMNGSIRAEERRIKLPNIGWVRLKERGYLPVTGIRITSVAVSEQAGRWYASVQVEESIPVSRIDGPVVGVDLGISRLATLSDGTVIDNPKPYRRRLRKLKKLQRSLSRKQRGSANRQKAKRRVARAHQKVANIRRHVLHEATTAIAKRYSTVVIEDLNVAGMMKNHCLAQAIGDVGMAEFRRQLTYKCDWYGSELVLAPRFYPSSKRCSNCGEVKQSLSLGERVYRCEACGFVCDRDLNAALNLKIVAVKSTETQNACGADVSLDSERLFAIEQSALKRELVA